MNDVRLLSKTPDPHDRVSNDGLFLSYFGQETVHGWTDGSPSRTTANLQLSELCMGAFRQSNRTVNVLTPHPQRHGLSKRVPRGGRIMVGLLVATCLSVLFSGCCSWHLGRRNGIAVRRRDRREIAVYRNWAVHALAGEPVSDGFRAGFVAGFVDQVFAGGGHTPFVPPARFWGTSRESDRQEWRLGFREGGDIAIEGGYAERALMGYTGGFGRVSMASAPAAEYYGEADDETLQLENSTLSRPLKLEPESIDFSEPEIGTGFPGDREPVEQSPALLDPELVVGDEISPAPSMSMPMPGQEPMDEPIEIDDWSEDPFADDGIVPPEISIPTPRESDSALSIDAFDSHENEDGGFMEYDDDGAIDGHGDVGDDGSVDDDLRVPSTSRSELFPSPPLARQRRSPPESSSSAADSHRGYSELIRASETASGRAFVDSLAGEPPDDASPPSPTGGVRAVSYEAPVRDHTAGHRRPTRRRRTTEDVISRTRTMFRDLDHLDR